MMRSEAGPPAADFRKDDKSSGAITGPMAGGETMADLESPIEGYMETQDGNPPPPKK